MSPPRAPALFPQGIHYPPTLTVHLFFISISLLSPTRIDAPKETGGFPSCSLLSPKNLKQYITYGRHSIYNFETKSVFLERESETERERERERERKREREREREKEERKKRERERERERERALSIPYCWAGEVVFNFLTNFRHRFRARRRPGACALHTWSRSVLSAVPCV